MLIFLLQLMASDSSGSMYQESNEDDLDAFDAYPTTEAGPIDDESESDGCGKGKKGGNMCNKLQGQREEV